MRKIKTIKSLKETFDTLVAFLEGSKEDQKIFCEHFNEFLDDLCSYDFFGTESQFDPRGRHKNE